MRNKILMTLALLLTAVTGAWAQTETPLVTIQASENSTFTSGSKTFNDIATVTITGNGSIDVSGWGNCTLTVTPADGVTITSVKFYGTSDGAVVEDTSSPFEAEIKYDSNISREVTKVNGTKAFDYGVKKIEVFGTAEPAITVEWNASTKTGNFTMPAYDVEIAPIYAPVAQWAKVDNVDQLPTAIEGVIADTDAPLIVEGTVAFAGQSTEVTQGTVMYAVTPATETEAPALDAANKWSADVPTAKLVPDAGDVKVWYYIKGADAPEGDKATAENTFNDSEICTEPITVTVLSNKFDITFKAANDNTIETGKATVTVGGTTTPATVTEGKLTGVKMGSEVKVKAKDGYKFRKVEVEKKAAPLAAAFKDGAKIKVGYQWGDGNTTYLEFTNSGGTYSLTSVSGANEGNGFNSSTLTVKNGNVLALDVVCQPSGLPKLDDFSAQIEFDATSSTYKYSSKGANFTGIISVSVNDTDITDQLSELK